MDRKRPKLSPEKRNAEKEYVVQRVASLEQDLAKKEAQLNLRNTEKEGLIQQVTSLEHDLVKKEADLAKKEANLAKKEADLAMKEANLAKKEANLAKKEANLAKKEADLAKKEADLAKKEAQLNLNNAEKEDLVQRVTSLEQDLAEKEGYLQLMSLYLDSDGSSVCSGVSVSDISSSNDDMEPVIVEESSETVLSETSNFDYSALKDEGNALYSAGDFPGAVQKYSKCLKLCTNKNTDRSTLLKDRAAAYLNLQEYEKVVEDTTAALEITPSDIKALYRRCQAYEQLGKYNEAFEDARAVNCLNPKNNYIQPYLRRLQEIKCVIVEESSATVLSETSNFDYSALKDEGNALYSAGDFLGAAQKYSKCLEFCTDNGSDRSTLLKNRAAAYLNLQEYQKVVEDTTAALEIIPSDIKAFYRRCQAYEELGKYNEAFADARAVNRLNPKSSAIQPYLRRLQEIVNESNDDALDINSFPNEIILNVFGYLEQNQLGQIARVCRKWNVLTKSPVLWKKVNVKLSPCHRYEYNVAESFIDRLPSCVTSISLNLMANGSLDFEKLCVKLQKKCPHLEELTLTNSEILDNLSSVIGFCTQMLQDVKNLVFHYSVFHCFCSTDGCFGISKIEILELLHCKFDCPMKPPFFKMPNLKQLHLYGTNIDDSWFKYGNSFLNQLNVLNLGFTKIVSRIFSIIQNHCHNLKELYLCSTVLQDRDLNFKHSAFPHLRTICLSHTWLTCEGVVSFIQSCPSLENVYVDEAVAVSFVAHPFVVANTCKSRIVKAIAWNHSHNVDYSHI